MYHCNIDHKDRFWASVSSSTSVSLFAAFSHAYHILRTWFYRNSARVLPSVLFLISRACACAMCERKFLCSGFLSGIQCYCICGGFSRIQCTCACAVDPNRYSALVHLRWIPRDYSALVSLDFSEKNCLALFFFSSFLSFLPCPPPICSSTCVLLLTLVLSYQPYSNFTPSGFNEVYFLHSCSLCSQNTPHLRQNARGGVYKKRMETVY